MKDLRAEEAVWEAETNASRKKMQVRIDEGNAKAERAIRMFDEVQSVNLKELTLETNFRLKFSHCSKSWCTNSDVLLEVLKQQKSQEIVSKVLMSWNN